MFKTIHIILVTLVGTLAALYFMATGASPLWWGAAMVMYFAFSCLGITVTFHRYLSHGSYKFRWHWMERLFILLGTLAGTGSALAWVAVHKEHHRHSDTEKDPHSPLNGLIHFLVPHYDDRVNYRYVRRLMRDRYVWFLHRHALSVFAAYYAVLFALGGLEAVAFLGVIPQAATSIMSSVLNWFTHTHGYRNYETNENSRNVWWLAPFTWGESWHNNHHAKPARASFRHKWWEIDISGIVIHTIKHKETSNGLAL